MHHSVDHLINRGNVDQADHATTGWIRSVKTPALFQLISVAGLSSADTERCYMAQAHDYDGVQRLPHTTALSEVKKQAALAVEALFLMTQIKRQNNY